MVNMMSWYLITWNVDKYLAVSVNCMSAFHSAVIVSNARDMYVKVKFLLRKDN